MFVFQERARAKGRQTGINGRECGRAGQLLRRLLNAAHGGQRKAGRIRCIAGAFRPDPDATFSGRLTLTS